METSIEYNSPTLLRQCEQLLQGGDIQAAGRKLHECLRVRVLAELEHHGLMEFDNGDPVESGSTLEILNLTALEGHTDAKALVILQTVLADAIKVESGGEVESEILRGHLFWMSEVLKGVPYLVDVSG